MAHPSRGNCREGRPVTARKRTLALSRSLTARARAGGSPSLKRRHVIARVRQWPFRGHSRLFADIAKCPDCPGDLNRSTQHLLILLDKEVADGDVTDIVHGEAEG